MAARDTQFLSLFFHSVFHIRPSALFADERTAPTLWREWQRWATLALSPASALLGTAPQWCSGQAGAVPKPAGGAPIPVFPPTYQLGSSSSPCSRFCQGNDSCTFSPLALDAVGQVRPNLLFDSLNSPQLVFAQAWLRRVCRVCSNAEF